MSPSRSAALLVLVPVLLVAAWWIATDPGAGGELPQAQAPAGNPEEEAPAAPAAANPGSAGVEAGVASPAAEAPARVEATAAGVALVGRVVDGEGAPIAGAQVSCAADLDYRRLQRLTESGETEAAERLRKARRDEPETRTAADGGFRLRAPVDDGTLRLRVRARGYQQLWREVPRPADEDMELGALQLERGAVLAGRVLDAGGLPVADATVRALPPGSAGWFADLVFANPFGSSDDRREDRTDAEGRFELAHVRPGPFVLRASHDEHPPQKLEQREVDEGEVIDDLLVVLAAGAAIEGRVVGAPPGEKLVVYARTRRARSGQGESEAPFATLSIDADDWMDGTGMAVGNRSAEIAADGTFALRGLEPGKPYRVWAVKGGGGFLRVSACTEVREVPAGSRGVDLPYAPGVSVAFHVVDAETGAPLAELRIDPRLAGGSGLAAMFSSSRPGSRRFDEYPGGRVTIADLRPKAKQKLDLRLEALGYTPYKREGLELPARGVLELGTIRLTPAPLLRVHVTESTTGQPVAGARVDARVVEPEPAGGVRGTVTYTATFGSGGPPSAGDVGVRLGTARDSRRRGETDEEGWCVLNSFPGQSVVVTVSSDDHASHRSEPLDLPAKGNREHEVGLVRGGAVDVLVLDADSRPVVETNVRRRGPGRESSSERTDARGVARFERLVPGEHRFQLWSGNMAAALAGARVRARVELAGAAAEPEPGWEAVAVVDGETAEVTLQKPPMGLLRGVVRENGLPLGRARVTFVHGPGASPDPMHAEMTEINERLAMAMGGGGSGTRADGEGRYELEDLPAGEHRLRVSHSDRAMTATVPIHIVEGEQSFDIDLTATVLTGRVVGPDGEPVARASVSVSQQGSSPTPYGVFGAMSPFGGRGAQGVETDDEGRYELRGVRAGEDLVVRARAKGFAPATSAVVRATEGQTVADVDVALSAAGSVAVTVTGEAPAFAGVTAKWAGEQAVGEEVAPVMAMMRRGKATLEGLRPGLWKIELAVPGENPSAQQVEVMAGETAEVELAK